MVRPGSLVALGLLVVVACTSADPPDPSSGEITIRYDGLRNDGMLVSDVFFILENHSTRVIAFRGTRTFWSGTIPVYAAMDCTSAKSSDGTYSGFPLVDFADSPPPYVNVAPGGRLRLNVGRAYGALIAQYRGGLCQLRLQLRRDEVIQSQQFRPIVTF